jgi:hypothetical protein
MVHSGLNPNIRAHKEKYGSPRKTWLILGCLWMVSPQPNFRAYPPVRKKRLPQVKHRPLSRPAPYFRRMDSASTGPCSSFPGPGQRAMETILLRLERMMRWWTKLNPRSLRPMPWKTLLKVIHNLRSLMVSEIQSENKRKHVVLDDDSPDEDAHEPKKVRLSSSKPIQDRDEEGPIATIDPPKPDNEVTKHARSMRSGLTGRLKTVLHLN